MHSEFAAIVVEIGLFCAAWEELRGADRNVGNIEGRRGNDCARHIVLLPNLVAAASVNFWTRPLILFRAIR